MTSSAKVIETILDLSGRVGSAPGIYSFIQLPGAKKGPVNKPTFITSVDELLNLYTPEGTIRPSDHLAFFEAVNYLSRANKLYVNRPDNGAAYGGLAIPKEAPAQTWRAEKAVTEGVQYKPTDLPQVRIDGTYYSVDDEIRPSVNAKFKFVCKVAGISSSTGADFSGVTAAGQEVEDGQITWESKALNHPTEFVYRAKTAGSTGATEPVWPTEVGAEVEDGTVTWEAVATAVAVPTEETLRDRNPELNHVFEDDELFYIFGKYPGKDNDNIGVKIYTYQNYPDLVKEEGAFIIEVYYRGNGQALETFTCSRKLTKKDGYGVNIYVENAVASSNYINVIDNPSIDDNVDPIDILEVSYLGGGYDGQELVTDGQMMAGADLINNRTTFPIKLLLDGSWCTPNYQRKLNAVASARKDCLALLSTPYSAENSASYVQDIVAYRKDTLNINSYWSAMYTPHIQFYDQYNDRNIWIGPSSSAAGAISEIATQLAPWYPPAGLNRGQLPTISDVKRRFNEPQMDLLCENQVNPIAFFSGEGIVIWGQQTLYSRPSALQSLNVMLLIITVMPEIAKALKWYLFEFNDNDTRKLIDTMVTDYMNTVKTNKGVYDFAVSVHATDDDVDNGRLYVDLLIKPTLAINEIRFRMVPVKTGASFSVSLEILEG